MDETTTTADSEVDTTGQPQVDSTTDTTAEAQDTQTQTDPDGTGESADAGKHDWLKNKGIDPADPEALDKVEQKWREAEQGFHQTRQEAKNQLRDEATKAIEATEPDPSLARIQMLESRIAVNDFFSAHPEARAMDADLSEIVKARPYLASDLEAVYAIARMAKRDDELKAAEKKGRAETKAEIAKGSAAGAPRGNASTTAEKSEDEARLERFSKW